jgi:hypothetical protein
MQQSQKRFWHSFDPVEYILFETNLACTAPVGEMSERFISPVPPIEYQKPVDAGARDDELPHEPLVNISFSELSGQTRRLVAAVPTGPVRIGRSRQGSKPDRSMIEPIALASFGVVVLYGFGATRVAALALLTLTVLWGSLPIGVTTAKFAGHAATLRRSPTVFADTSMSGSTSTCISFGKLPSAS